MLVWTCPQFWQVHHLRQTDFYNFGKFLSFFPPTIKKKIKFSKKNKKNQQQQQQTKTKRKQINKMV